MLKRYDMKIYGGGENFWVKEVPNDNGKYIKASDYIEEWCKNRDCENYVEWRLEQGYDTDGNPLEPYKCKSCKLQGQSYNINKVAEDCPYRDQQ